MPGQRVRYGDGIHHPAIAGPPDAHRAQFFIFVPHVEDIGVAIGLEKGRPALGLALKEREDGGKCSFDTAFAAEIGDDLW